MCERVFIFMNTIEYKPLCTIHEYEYKPLCTIHEYEYKRVFSIHDSEYVCKLFNPPTRPTSPHGRPRRRLHLGGRGRVLRYRSMHPSIGEALPII